jgi:hypothetical protein
MIFLFNITFFYQVTCRHIDHVENVTEENRDEILIKNLMGHCHEKLMDHLDDKKVLMLTTMSIIIEIYMLSVLTLISIGLCH